MANGIVLFACNNQEISYVKLAENSARRAAEFLKMPVSIITDEDSCKDIKDRSLFDNVINIKNSLDNFRTFKDGDKYRKTLSWKNLTRDCVYELTPYENTLVLDVDFLINSNALINCWNQPHDFLIYKNSFDLATWRKIEHRYISDTAVTFYWATVFFFKKNKKNEMFFSLVKHIKNNWHYYNFLYKLSSPNFRNDFAFSIAIHIMNGYSNGNLFKDLPGKLYYTLDTDYFLKIKNKDMFFLCRNTQNQYNPIKVSNLDVHVMNKYSLLRTINE